MSIRKPQEKQVTEAPKGEVLLYQSDDGSVRLDVRLEDETVWLTQPLMAELFQTTQQNISQHVQNIYEEGELIDEATHKKFLSVRQEGNRQVKRNLDYYNLDMIISVGHRVKSLIATRFRIWSKRTFSCARKGEAATKHILQKEFSLKNGMTMPCMWRWQRLQNATSS